MGRWVLILVWIAVATGCQTGPGRAMQGARHYSAGTKALNQGEGTRAIKELEQAAILVPHASEVQNHLGLAYWSDGQLVDARVAFERAIELDCDNTAARANLDQLRVAEDAEVDSVRARGEKRRSDGG
jgi:Flp pilus assembly protein TadD